MAVVNIPPNSPILSLGRVPSPMHVYDQGGAPTQYDLTIINVGAWQNVAIQPGHTDTYRPENNAVYIRNNGPSRLQVLYFTAEDAVTPAEAGWQEVESFPSAEEGVAGALGELPQTPPPQAPIPITGPSSLANLNLEVTKYFTFNETGNILLSTTSPDGQKINPSVESLFSEVAVFFAAMTKAITSKGATIYNYGAINDVVAGSGLFISVDEEDYSFTQSSQSLTFNTELIAGFLGLALTDGADILIAQQVLQALGKQATFSHDKVDDQGKVAHLLFVCEYLMGMPLVSVQFFSVDKTVASTVFKAGPCATGTSYQESIAIHRATYMFVVPKFIREYSPDLASAANDSAFGELVAQLAALIKTSS